MGLQAQQFSDLIILPTGEGLLKGLPGQGQQLSPVPEDCREDVKHLLNLFNEANRDRETFRITDGQLAYRVASYQDIGGRVWFLRRLAESVPDFSKLGYPDPIRDWLLDAKQQKGLVLFSGPQSSGKTTSAGAYIAARLKLYGGHGVTFENPVEMPLAGAHGEHGFCFQTEISCEEELAAHIEQAHRFGSPDIISIGEIRTKHAASEVLRVALGSSRQIVTATIHGLDAITALDRLLTWAKSMDGDIAYANLAHALLAILHQELIPEADEHRLRLQQFLLVPFTDRSMAIRSKLREGKLAALAEDMREQRNRITYQGIGAI